MVSQCTKFEVSRFTRYDAMNGGAKCRKWEHSLITRLRLHMADPCTKFDVSSISRYESMNGSAKCQKMGQFGVVTGHSRSWAMPPFDRAHTTSYSTLIETKLCVYLLPFLRYSRSKVADFDALHLHLAPSQGLTPVEFCGDLWRQKTRVPALSCGAVCVILRLAVLVEHRLVTDRRTRTQTDTDTDTGPWLVPRMHSIAR